VDRLIEPAGVGRQLVVDAGTKLIEAMPVNVAVAVTEGPATQTATDVLGQAVVPLTRKLQLVEQAGGFAAKEADEGVTGAVPGVPLIVCVVVNAA
jgi:hypothetical protein